MPVAMGHGGPWLQGPRGPRLVLLPPGPYVLGWASTPYPHSAFFAFYPPWWLFPLHPLRLGISPLNVFFLPLPRGVLFGTLPLGWVSSSSDRVLRGPLFFCVWTTSIFFFLFFNPSLVRSTHA